MAFFSEATMSIAIQAKTVRCPFCDELVEHNKEQDFYKCPTCGCEIWPEQQEDKTYWEGFYKIYLQEVNRTHKPGSSNRSGRKQAKKNAPLFTERYKLD
jgi:predicted RNA-binding Zn-ribbon protein involved in translation (DUF1610 family)